MDGDQKPKFQFTDEAIKKASDMAIERGREREESTTQIIEKATQNSDKESEPEEKTSLTDIPDIEIKNLRTFQGDVAEAIKKQNASVLTVALAEQKRKRKQAGEVVTQENVLVNPERDRRASILERITGEKPDMKVGVTPVKPVAQTPRFDYNTFEEKPAVIIREKKKTDPNKTKNTVTIIVSLLLIVLGIGAVVGFYILQRKPPTIAPPAPVDQTILSFDQKSIVSTVGLDRQGLIQKISDLKRDTKLGGGEVLYISLIQVSTSTSQISTAQLLSILHTEIPGSAQRSFGSQFMFGLENSNGNQPFLLVDISDFDNAYSGMLNWEKTLNQDLGPIFSPSSLMLTSITPTPSFNQSTTTTIASSTKATTTSKVETKVVNLDVPSGDGFQDITIKNKDARILKNQRGDTILLYSFLDRNTLLITSKQEVLIDIINKYISGKLVR